MQGAYGAPPPGSMYGVPPQQRPPGPPGPGMCLIFNLAIFNELLVGSLFSQEPS